MKIEYLAFGFVLIIVLVVSGCTVPTGGDVLEPIDECELELLYSQNALAEETEAKQCYRDFLLRSNSIDEELSVCVMELEVGSPSFCEDASYCLVSYMEIKGELWDEFTENPCE